MSFLAICITVFILCTVVKKVILVMSDDSNHIGTFTQNQESIHFMCSSTVCLTISEENVNLLCASILFYILVVHLSGDVNFAVRTMSLSSRLHIRSLQM